MRRKATGTQLCVQRAHAGTRERERNERRTRVLHITDVEAGLAKESPGLIADQCREGGARSERRQPTLGDQCDCATARADRWQHRARDAQRVEQRRIPVQRHEPHQHGARRIRDVRDVSTAVNAAREVPREPCINRAKECMALLRKRPNAVDVIEDPA